ncbi:NAD(P)/FAD-dependent oxidoreductase [Pararhizobium sp. IMCC21322]|uniref:NAD(P)/FAD-dependent oxidoreductase n=1 Tax=Pararhizobium sp. IMCC21322 TaxID=3067903 RepID=UPI002741F7E4|nr:NAD(P)/FAD-dependent oxidoreductase [Pararhizobium sp. IMCC21322]
MSDTNESSTVRAILAQFQDALSTGDVDRAAECFLETGYWRDLLSFTWNIKTMEGRTAIVDMLNAQLKSVKPSQFRIDDTEQVTEEDGVISAWFNFETSVGRGRGHLRLKDKKIWTLLTSLSELKGHEEQSGHNRPLGAQPGVNKNRTNWKEDREHELADLGYGTQPYTIIIGGGQGGIAMGARLRQLGVPTIILDKNKRPGDSWRNRYKSLCLHDPVWYDHLPYLPFPKTWPVFTPKDKIGDWLEMYTKVMELNYWTSSVCKSAAYDEASKEWSIEVDRDGEKVSLKAKQLVLATGMSGKPNIPEFPGADQFKGDQHHSSKHPGPDAYKGKKALVIGSNNSAHDICAALWENDVDVTMIQRSTTHIVRSESLIEHGLRPLYSEKAADEGMTTEKADLTFASIPYGLLPEFQKPVYDTIREHDKDFYTSLEKAGFKLDYGVGDTGLFLKYLRRGSGYYIDVGASQLVIDGQIKLAQGQVQEIVEDGVLLADGTKLEADLIVYATGYNSMSGWVADLIGQDVADKVGICWGLGSETPKDPGPWQGELRNMWKPTQQAAMWFHGGNLHQSRHYSQYLALQIKARMEDIPTPVYGLPETHNIDHG